MLATPSCCFIFLFSLFFFTPISLTSKINLLKWITTSHLILLKPPQKKGKKRGERLSFSWWIDENLANLYLTHSVSNLTQATRLFFKLASEILWRKFTLRHDGKRRYVRGRIYFECPISVEVMDSDDSTSWDANGSIRQDSDVLSPPLNFPSHFRWFHLWLVPSVPSRPSSSTSTSDTDGVPAPCLHASLLDVFPSAHSRGVNAAQARRVSVSMGPFCCILVFQP